MKKLIILLFCIVNLTPGIISGLSIPQYTQPNEFSQQLLGDNVLDISASATMPHFIIVENKEAIGEDLEVLLFEIFTGQFILKRYSYGARLGYGVIDKMDIELEATKCCSRKVCQFRAKVSMGGVSLPLIQNKTI